MTSADQARLPDSALRAEAIAQARRAGTVYTGHRVSPEDSEPRVHMDALRAGLSIGDWHDRWQPRRGTRPARHSTARQRQAQG